MEHGLQKANHYNQLAEWAQRVEACRRSGQKVSEWCKEQGIPVSTYCLTKKPLFPLERRLKFINSEDDSYTFSM